MIVALAILAVGVAVNWKGLPHDTREQELPVSSALVSASSTTITDRDSDADGLPDWEEHLYGSDPLKFDTDGDGTPDGEEVREGRDPSKANTAGASSPPNDMLAVAQDPHFAIRGTITISVKFERVGIIEMFLPVG